MSGRKKEDFKNRVFNKLTVIKENGRSKSGDILWLCQCSCENKTIITVTASNLRTGHTQSCGCLNKEINYKRLKKYNKYDLSNEYGIGYTFNNEEFYFDLEDYDKIKNYCWYKTQNNYIVTHINDSLIFIHRLILNLENNNTLIVDHQNGCTNDNRKINLRKCSMSKNNMNKKTQTNNTSGIVGVNYFKQYDKWRVYISIDNKRIHLGYFDDFNEAVKVRKLAEEKYFGEFSYDNSRKVSEQ